MELAAVVMAFYVLPRENRLLCQCYAQRVSSIRPLAVCAKTPLGCSGRDGHVGNDVVQRSCPTDPLQVAIGALLVAGSGLFTIRYFLMARVTPGAGGTASNSPNK